MLKLTCVERSSGTPRKRVDQQAEPKLDCADVILRPVAQGWSFLPSPILALSLAGVECFLHNRCWPGACESVCGSARFARGHPHSHGPHSPHKLVVGCGLDSHSLAIAASSFSVRPTTCQRAHTPDAHPVEGCTGPWPRILCTHHQDNRTC